MSARSTPGPAPLSRSSSALLSPASISPFSFDPSSSKRPRQPYTSLALPPVPETNFRRSSNFSGRITSQGSVSGTSTPSYAKRRAARRDAQLAQLAQLSGRGGVDQSGQIDQDWAGMEPDEVFRKLPVNEVKKVEAKMRADALNKQSELRSMVGTRYRDLLTSATQITSLHESSLRLSTSLKSVAKACSIPNDISINAESESTGQSEGEDVMSLLPIAAHMKLLLDTPEALYSHLARHSYLQAAFLWLIARVVKESLSSMPEEVNGAYLPLLQKQWETLLPFRAQIVQRATVALRSRRQIEPKTLSETLLATILLDNLPVPDALALFLSQRTKTIRDILSHPSESSSFTTKHLLTPSTGQRLGDSQISTKSTSRERDDIKVVLIDAVKSLLETVSVARDVFEKQQRLAGKESMIEEMIRLVQIGEPLPPAQAVPTLRKSSHDRRASRLASISLPLSIIHSSSSGPPVSSALVIQTLPPFQILLRHLPSTITRFTPFITPSPAPNLDEKLKNWQDSSIKLLREAVPAWLTALESIKDIWRVRTDLNRSLENGVLEVRIKDALESEWADRVKHVWTDKLDGLVQMAETRIREVVEEIRANGDENDTQPESFIFSELPFPATPALALTASNAPFNAFLSAVKKRTVYRTPLLDSVLVALESAALDIKSDIGELPGKLLKEYRNQLSGALDALIRALEKVLESMGPGREDGRSGVDAEIFVGRVALYLGKSSSLLGDLVGETRAQLDITTEALVRIHGASVVRWGETAVEHALSDLTPLFHPFRGPRQIRASWQGPQPVAPSTPIMIALQTLVKAVRQLGIPPTIHVQVVKDLVTAFVERSKNLDGWANATDEGVAQAAFDLSFLGLINGDTQKDVVVRKLLNKLPEDLPGGYASELDSLVLDHLRRTQVLLHPLVRHLDPSDIAPRSSNHEAGLKGGLLRFGPPKGSSGVNTEFRSPLAVAKPGKRFGLLSVAA